MRGSCGRNRYYHTTGGKNLQPLSRLKLESYLLRTIVKSVSGPNYEPSCGPSFQAQLLPGHQPQPHQRQPGGPRHLAVIHRTSRLGRGGNHKVNSANGSYNQYIQHPVAFSDTYFFPRYSYWSWPRTPSASSDCLLCCRLVCYVMRNWLFWFFWNFDSFSNWPLTTLNT